MFDNLGRALYLLRDLRGLNQVTVARQAGLGKSQLSKYEAGKELPKLDSLAKVLSVLGIGPAQFFFAMNYMDRCTATLGGELPSDLESLELARLLHPVSETFDAGFSQVITNALRLYRLAYAESPGAPGTAGRWERRTRQREGG